MNALPDFTFNKVIEKIKTIDVIWLNNDNFPVNIFEVENSTDFKTSLIKFYELINFNTEMTIIAPGTRRDRFFNVLEYRIFTGLKDRVKFFDYEKVDTSHSAYNQVNEVKL